MRMEFRSWITIPGLPYSAEQEHERFFDVLRRDFENLGPVMSWTGDGTATKVVLATDAAHESAAAAEMISAVALGLQRAGLGYLYPAAIEIELAEDELVPA